MLNFFFQSNLQIADCQNNCCESNPCLNGGTCRESCDVFADVSRVNVVLTLMGDSVRVVIIHFSCL